ncbi:TorF family putative porin [Paraburkholderia madseniana]|nr:TorF family putative porin [Paraburkholderia madseniana]
MLLRGNLLFLLALLIARPAAAAMNDWQFELNAATGRTTRGLNESGGQPVVGAAASWYPAGGLFAGISASSFKIPRSSQTGAEIIASGGYEWRIAGDWTIQASLTHYQYEHVPFANRMNYDEAALRGGWRDSVFVSVTASPNTGFGPSPRSRAFSYDVAGRLPLVHGFSATGGIGYYDLRAEKDIRYVYGDVGLTYQYRSAQFDLWYIFTNGSATADARLGPIIFNGLIADVVWQF